MKRLSLIWLAASSLLLGVIAKAESRPHYGGTLRVSVREAPQAFDPAAMNDPASSSISRLIFETLVTLDQRGRPQPLLASSWETEPGNQRWRFSLRSGVFFHDGSPLDAGTVASCLRTANPEWKIMTAGNNEVIIETQSDDAYVPAELALARNAIVHRGRDQSSGTGPFAIAQWTSGKHLRLHANDQYWAGRPYLDSIEVEFGKSDRDQVVAFDLGKTDVAEIAPENIRRTRAEGRDVISSQPEELMALVFSSEARSEDEIHTRNALALSLDTASINNVVLQDGGQPTGALLPNWLSGYGFVFPAQTSTEQARHEQSQARHFVAMTLSYEAADPIARIIAERVLLNARDVGITLQLTTSSNADLRLVRLPLSSLDAYVALIEYDRMLRLPPVKFHGSSISDLFTAEKDHLQSHQIVPLLHLRSAVALAPNARDFSMFPDGSWRMDNVWLAPEKP